MDKECTQDIKQQIQSLDLSITNYWQVVNQEGIWLFLATLGAWSVSNTYLQYTAGVIIFVIFLFRLIARIKENGLFSTRINAIKKKITKDLDKDSDQSKARFFDLEQVTSRLSSISSLKSTLVYSLCAFYFIVSALYWVGFV